MAESDSTDAVLNLSEWITVKKAQWDRVAGHQPGLQLIRYGSNGTVFMITKSMPEFYEGVVFGQIPDTMKIEIRKGPRRYTRPAREDEKPVERRAVDLSDAELQGVVDAWANGKSALTLPFVPYIYDRNGKLRTRLT